MLGDGGVPRPILGHYSWIRGVRFARTETEKTFSFEHTIVSRKFNVF